MSEFQELLPLYALGDVTPEERARLEVALAGDAALREELAAVVAAYAALGRGETLAPPAWLREKVLAQARLEGGTSGGGGLVMRTASRRRVLALVFATTLAAALGLGVVAPRLLSSPAPAWAVATTQSGLTVLANNSSRTPVVLIDAGGAKQTVSLPLRGTPRFSRVVSQNGFSYLLDSDNNVLWIVDESTRRLADQWPVPSGSSGLAVQDDMVVVVSSSGTALSFRRNGLQKLGMVEARIAPAGAASTTTPDSAVMDGDVIFATNQHTGLVTRLERHTGNPMESFRVGQAPVSLAVVGPRLYVVDQGKGRDAALHALTLGGVAQAKANLPGKPERITLAPNNTAYVFGRDGWISLLDLKTMRVLQSKQSQKKIMDLTLMQDGHVCVAADTSGVLVLDEKLEEIRAL